LKVSRRPVTVSASPSGTGAGTFHIHLTRGL
jgi:hypothetical protein